MGVSDVSEYFSRLTTFLTNTAINWVVSLSKYKRTAKTVSKFVGAFM